MPVKLLKLPAVLKRVTISQTRLYAQIKDGTFPAPISLGGRAVAWTEQDVENWILDRIEAARNSTQQAKQEPVA